MKSMQTWHSSELFIDYFFKYIWVNPTMTLLKYQGLESIYPPTMNWVISLTLCYRACRDHSWYTGEGGQNDHQLNYYVSDLKLYNNIFKETYYWPLRRRFFKFDTNRLRNQFFRFAPKIWEKIIMQQKVHNSVTYNISKFNFQKVNLNIFEGARGGYTPQKSEKLLLLN